MTDSPSGGSPAPALRPARFAPGRRKRRLRWAVTGLIIAVALAAAFLVFRSCSGLPETRKPGEELPDITRSLAKGLPQEAPLPHFTEVTQEAGLGAFVTFAGSRSSQLPEDMGAGAAWGDFDNDGDDDLFLVSAGGPLTASPDQLAPSQLYENLGGGNFSRRDDFPETRIHGMAAAWGDYDGDGWLDLVVTGYRSFDLFHNEAGRLVPVPAPAPAAASRLATGFWAGASWADFDGDGDLDLYVCGYVRYQEDTSSQRRGSQQYGATVPYTLNPASFDPLPNLLLQNDDGQFADVAQIWGVSNPTGRSLTALWHDFDQDGRLDLYVANDISDNALFLNRGETFEDAGLAAWVADYRGAMGLAVGDWNRDGDDDLFVTHWIAQENALYDSRLEDSRKARQAQGLPGPPPLSFSDLASPLGLGQIALHRVGWGTEFGDFDSDGWLDLFVANGSTLEEEGEPKTLKTQPAMLLWNQRGQYFHDLAAASPPLAQPQVSRGLALSDYDLDGDLDALILRLDGGAQLLRNDSAQGHWLQLRLRSTVPGRAVPGFAEGATAIVRAGDLGLRRTVGSVSYLSQSTQVLHFGLGDLEAIDGVEIQWLGGETQVFGPLEVDRRWQLTQGEGAAKPLLTADSRQRQLAFWQAQRAAMDAMKREGDLAKAVALFRQALALNPDHEDSRYYLANCLASLGQMDGAFRQLEELLRRNPQSHRGHKQWGVLRALTAHSAADLEAAEEALQRSLVINSEETGTLLLLGELALLQGRTEEAQQRLEWACRTNHRAVGGFFLRAYLAWSQGNEAGARDLLREAKKARGEDWKPEGAVAEGETASLLHREPSPLSHFWRSWSGDPEPASALAGLKARLASFPSAPPPPATIP